MAFDFGCFTGPLPEPPLRRRPPAGITTPTVIVPRTRRRDSEQHEHNPNDPPEHAPTVGGPPPMETPTTPRPSRTGRPWQRKKRRIIRRDGGICHLCNRPGADTADHLIPWSQGGTDADTNLRAAHIDCNRKRGARPIAIAQAELMQTTNGWDW